MPGIKTVLIATARVFTGVTLVVSGFVKAIDPLGSQYKFQDYLAAMGVSNTAFEWLTLIAAVLLSTFELTLGVCLLLAIARRLSTRLLVAFMMVMTLLTVWIFFENPVQDCGCFGEAFILTNGETLAKNILLLAVAVFLAWHPMQIQRCLSKSNQWFVFQGTVAASVLLSLWCLYDLPLIDFRPYHIGADIKAGMLVPDNAEQPEFETTFILEKGGERKEFTLENYPDSTWMFIDSKTVTVKEGYVPPIHDFEILSPDGEDITESVLNEKDYSFLLVSPNLKYADDQNFGDIDRIYEFCNDRNLPFRCLTASTEEDILNWQNLTGAEYPFFFTDATTLKTIVRSNPGLVMLKNGVVVGKWSHNRLPNPETLEKMVKKTSSQEKKLVKKEV